MISKITMLSKNSSSLQEDDQSWVQGRRETRETLSEDERNLTAEDIA